MKSSMEPASQALWKDPDETRRKKDRPEKKITRKLLGESVDDSTAAVALKARKTRSGLSEDDDWDENDMLTILEYRRRGFIPHSSTPSEDEEE